MLAAFFPADQHVLRPDAYRGTLTPSRNRTVALQKANEITLIAANLSATYNPTVPTDVARLDYYGRALEFWLAVGDIWKLRDVAREIRCTWNAVKKVFNQ